jgi:hypothetical protein
VEETDPPADAILAGGLMLGRRSLRGAMVGASNHGNRSRILLSMDQLAKGELDSLRAGQ